MIECELNFYINQMKKTKNKNEGHDRRRVKQGIRVLTAVLLPVLRTIKLNTWLVAFPEDHLRHSKELQSI